MEMRKISLEIRKKIGFFKYCYSQLVGAMCYCKRKGCYVLSKMFCWCYVLYAIKIKMLLLYTK